MIVSDHVVKNDEKYRSPRDFMADLCGLHTGREEWMSAKEAVELLSKQVTDLEKSGYTNIRFKAGGEYDYITLELHFDREETEEEKQARLEKEKKDQAKKELKQLTAKVKKELEEKYKVKL